MTTGNHSRLASSLGKQLSTEWLLTGKLSTLSYPLYRNGASSLLAARVDGVDSSTSATFMPSESPTLLRHLKWFRSLGSTPLKISKKSLSTFSKPYVTKTAFILLAIFGYNSMETVAVYRDKSLGWKISVAWNFLTVFSVLVILLQAILNRFKFETAVRKLIALQLVLGHSKYPVFASLKFTIVFWTVCLIIRSVYKTAVANETGDSSWLVIIVYTILWNVDVLNAMSVCCEFLYLVNCISSCFSALSNTKFVENIEVKRFIKIYSHLEDVVSDLNCYYDYTILFILFSSSTEVVLLTGMVYNGQEQGNEKSSMVACFSLLIIIAAAIMIINTCQHVSDQADLCNSVLLNHLITNAKVSVFDDPSSLTHLSLKTGLSFKVLKSISVNYNLGTSMIAAYITYTIVLFQFYSTSSASREALLNLNAGKKIP